jgi:uridine phosphorylase
MENGVFSPSELPLRDGRVYHLDLAPHELASNVLIVGDPERVPFLSDEFLTDREVDRGHRGLRTITGHVRETGQRVTITTSGMGTPSMEIVLNELVALNEFNFATRLRKESYEPLTVVRVGTSGGLQADTELGALIVTDYGVGLDNTGLYYDAPLPDTECGLLERRVRTLIEEALPQDVRFRGRFHPYGVRADCRVRVALEREALHLGVPCKRGVTVTSPGFFAEQGRKIGRVPPTVPALADRMASLDTGIPGLRVENMEMEASFLLHFLGGCGYRAGVVCAVINKHSDGTFLTAYRDTIRKAALVALRAFRALGTAPASP